MIADGNGALILSRHLREMGMLYRLLELPSQEVRYVNVPDKTERGNYATEETKTNKGKKHPEHRTSQDTSFEPLSRSVFILFYPYFRVPKHQTRTPSVAYLGA